jgi:hypothetical protein
MRSNKILIVIVSLLPLFAFKCITKKMRENFIQINNQLPVDVYCLPSFDYPDTTLLFTSKERILANDSIYYVGSLKSKRLFYIDLCKIETWERLVKSDSIQIFVFDEKVLKEKPWNEIFAGKLYLRRLTYTYKDIVDKGCKITIQ